MKILLFSAPIADEGISISSLLAMEPLALEYVAAGVQEHHDVKFVDFKLDTEPGFKEVMESYQPDVIGCGPYTTDVIASKRIMAEAKKMSPNILTVVGGHHATVMPEDFFDEYIDIIVVGEGVFPFRKICQYHEKQKGFEDIENIYYRKNGKMVFTRKEPRVHLDTFPVPNREITAHIRDKYQAYMLDKPLHMGQIMGSYGCIYRCKFCAISTVTDYKVHRRSIDKIVEELASIEEPYVYWVDDEFFLDPEWATQLAREVEKAGIKKDYFFLARSDTLVKNPGCIEAWARTARKCLVGIGFESHRDKDLKEMRKGTSISKNDEAVRILRANDMNVRGCFIINQDFEKSDFRQLRDYLRELDLDVATFSIWTPLPGTKLYEETRDQLITDNYNLFDCAHTVLPTKLGLKDFYKNYTWLIKNTFPLTKKLKMFRKMEPQHRRKVITAWKNILKQIKNAYQLYDKSLW
jgi:radical SAM superfamily enzyme YgiQ (UPF0313 family)